MAERTLPEPGQDVRLIVADLDGTLLDGDKQVPDSLWPLLHQLHERGITFSPASGRQYAMLAYLFEREADGMVFIAENGAYVVRDGEELSSATIGTDVVHGLVRTVRELVETGLDLGAVVCGKRSAYVERTDRAFRQEAEKYYLELADVDDLTRVDDEFLKVAVYDFGDAEARTLPALEKAASDQQVVLSGGHWVDVMSPDASKATVVHRLQEKLGVTSAQTMAFGDYLNDLGLLAAADLSFAVANAHPDVLAAARYIAPSNEENGVVTTIQKVLGLD
ncbi:Cof-type HAD-IIB family hydrolase [Cryobacterium sp. BB307]|uniref:Cof-type HAD-IIB family hydrolase n=1 Tax=Cryobacterium sp. BB307 TaxID=2716317 RepID=UPI0014479CDF|nr:Cof-type HAD-IIB family hydrolase [Cryobacterium sp. BB307]